MKQVRQKVFIVISLLLFATTSIVAQHELIAKYDFTTKSTVPVFQVPGVDFGSQFGVWNSTEFPHQVAISEDGYLEVRGYGTGVSSQRYGYIPITPDEGKTVCISRVVIRHFKEDGSNTARTRSYLYDMEGSAPKDGPKISTQLIQNNNGGVLIPATLTQQSFNATINHEFNSVRYMSLSATQSSNDVNNLSHWKIESLEFYGYVVSPGDIVATGSINFGNVQIGNEVDQSVSIRVIGGTSTDVTVELIDPTNSFFCMQTVVEAIDATAGTNVRVSYMPSSFGRHEAQLKFTSGDKVVITQLTGSCPMLNENFTYYVTDRIIWEEMDSTKMNDYDQQDYLQVPGWNFSDSVYWHLSGAYGLGIELRGSQDQAAFAATPELDLSMPFGLEFRSKKMSNRTTVLGELYVLVDTDTIYSIENPNNVLSLRTVEGFIATPESKITFVGLANDSSKIVVDEISVFPTFKPTLSLPAYSTIQFSSSEQPVTINIPVKAYQLESDVQIELFGNPDGYELLTPVLTIADAEAGSNIQVKYTKPQEGVEVNATLEVKGGGLTEYRYINLINDAATGLSQSTLNALVYGRKGSVVVQIDEQSSIEIFSLDGKKVVNQLVSGYNEISINKGLYIVRIVNATGTKIQKIHVR